MPTTINNAASNHPAASIGTDNVEIELTDSSSISGLKSLNVAEADPQAVRRFVPVTLLLRCQMICVVNFNFLSMNHSIASDKLVQ